MSARLILTAALSVVLLGGLAADPPKVDWAGKVKWADGYPKPYPATDKTKGGVELLGTYEVPDGWATREIQFDYFPKNGGGLKTDKTVKLIAGKWGVMEDKTKTVVPARVPLDKGAWSVRILIRYETAKLICEPDRKADPPVEVQTMWVNVEVE